MIANMTMKFHAFHLGRRIGVLLIITAWLLSCTVNMNSSHMASSQGSGMSQDDSQDDSQSFVVVSPSAHPTDSSISNESGGQIVLVSDRDGNLEIYTMRTDGSEQRRLTFNEANDSEPSWSPDGKQIVFISDRDGRSSLYVMNADGSDQRRLMDNLYSESQPRWSPDGKQIIFTAYQDGNYSINLLDLESRDVRQVVGSEHRPQWPSWSHDGQFILFVSSIDHNNVYQNELYLTRLFDNEITQLSSSEQYNTFMLPRWSPDNQKIVYSTLLDPVVLILDTNTLESSYLIDHVSEGQLGQIIPNQLTPSWSPLGDKIIFAGSDRYNSDIFLLDLSTGKLTQLTDGPSNDLSPDWWSP